MRRCGTHAERETFGSQIGEHQLVKQMIANMGAGIEAGRLLCLQAAYLKNHGKRNTRETSLAKWHATEHAVRSALDAIQIHGAYGYSNEYPVERYLRNSKAAVIYEGTSQLHTLIQADYLLGYREDKPLRRAALPAQGFEESPDVALTSVGRIACASSPMSSDACAASMSAVVATAWPIWSARPAARGRRSWSVVLGHGRP